MDKNRGVGLGIVNRILASSDPYTLYLTSRSGNDLPKAKDPHTFHSVKLDVSDPASVKAFAAQVEKEQGKGGVDALINNAGLNVDQSKGYNREAVRETMKTNFYGTRAVRFQERLGVYPLLTLGQMCDAFLPLLKKGGRIVNVASVAGHLNGYSSSAKDKMKDASTSLGKLNALLEEYEGLLDSGKETDAGFKNSAYCISKAFTVALTKALAATYSSHPINCCCPGWVNTVSMRFLNNKLEAEDYAGQDMGNQIGKPPKTIEDGAKIPLRCAVGDIQGSTGEFWENKDISSTADGQVSSW
jgi:carbonyl reductase 1